MSMQGYAAAGASAAALEKQMDAIRDKPAEDFVSDGQPRRGARSIPGYYYDTNTAQDQAMKYRFAAATGAGANPASARALEATMASELGLPADGTADSVPSQLLRNFKVELTPQDVEWLESRRRAKEQIEFDDWLTKRVDISNPAENRWLQEKYPEFWTRRERYIDDKINIEARLAKIRARGANTIEDFKLLFALDKGYLSAATAPLWSGATAGGPVFRKGLLSFYRTTVSDAQGGRIVAPGTGRFANVAQTFTSNPLGDMYGTQGGGA